MTRSERTSPSVGLVGDRLWQLQDPADLFDAGGNIREGIARQRDAPAGFAPEVLATFEREAALIDVAALPRAFQLDPTGTWLYALNQKGDSIVQFTIDQQTGQLTPTGNISEVPTPVSLVFTTGG